MCGYALSDRRYPQGYAVLRLARFAAWSAAQSISARSIATWLARGFYAAIAHLGTQPRSP